MQKVFVFAAKRTSTGSYGGSLSTISAVELASLTLKNLLENLPQDAIDQVVLGNVLSANLGQNPARQVTLKAGLSQTICATNINKVCASGMKAISVVANDIMLGNIEAGVAGGTESMSNVPHYLPKARFGLGYGNAVVVDGLAFDGLTDVYSQKAMGTCGDATAQKYQIARAEQDDFAELSFKRAIDATEANLFENEIVPIKIESKKGDVIVSKDEQITKVNFDKIKTLKPIFSADGTVTAANASPLSDGASFVLLGNEDFGKKHHLKPLAEIVAYAEAEHEPTFFTTAPVSATQKLLAKTKVNLNDIALFEVNEAFAVVPLAFAKELGIDSAKINLRGGAIALGHALGSSGSRIVVSLTHQLAELETGSLGLAAICNGGGGASALLIKKC